MFQSAQMIRIQTATTKRFEQPEVTNVQLRSGVLLKFPIKNKRSVRSDLFYFSIVFFFFYTIICKTKNIYEFKKIKAFQGI